MRGIYGTAFSYPAVDSRVDLTGLYLFPAPQAPGRTVIAVSVCQPAGWFREDAVYELLASTGEPVPAVALRLRFTGGPHQAARLTLARLNEELVDGHIREDLETATLVAAAPVSAGIEPVVTEGEAGVLLFAGVRSEPLFLAGNVGCAGQQGDDDFFAGGNCLAIVVEVPDELLVPGRRLGVWARTLVPMMRQRDHFTQFDQEGAPLLSMLLTDRRDRYLLDRTPPARQSGIVTCTGAPLAGAFAARLAATGGYLPAEAEQAARALLPSILVLDRDKPPGLPNGRLLSDDAAGRMLELLTRGAARNHAQPRPGCPGSFPYLGSPAFS